MNRKVAVGDTIRVLNRTHGLAPAREADAPSKVVEIINDYTSLVRTESGRLVDPTNFEVVRWADAERSTAVTVPFGASRADILTQLGLPADSDMKIERIDFDYEG